ncbi:MAG: AMP-binding protein [Clostridia bacterium]|nr:AMP-binding protein [Clostridia bacterium]
MKRKKTQRIYTPAENMKHYVQMLGERGDKVLFRYFEGKEIVDMSYGEFQGKVMAFAAALDTLGLDKKRVAIVGETSYQWVSAYVATLASGGVAIPLDKELDIDALCGFLEISEAEVIVYSKTFNDKFADIIKEGKYVKHFVPIDSDTVADNVISYDKMIGLGKASLAEGYTLPETDLERLATMLFTSGTTGTSKCVWLSEKNTVSSMNAACECVEFFYEDTIVSVLPLHHTYELCCMLAGMNYGMTIALNDSIKKVLKNFGTFRPTGLVLVPLFVNTMYKKIMSEAEKQGKLGFLKFAIKLSRFLRKFGIDLRYKLFKSVRDPFGGRLVKIVCGGAPLNPQMVKEFEEFGIYISEGYGITECSPLVSVSPYFAPKSGSVGPAVNSCTVKIDGDEVNEKGFVSGEILVKGSNVMIGYYNNDEENEKVFTEDGYFRTGDIGYMDGDGYIYITGRKKSVIVLENGKNVFPEEIEEYLENVESIAESVVVGRTDSEGIVTLTAICYPAYDKFDGMTEDELQAKIRADIAHLNKKLAGFKQIRDIEFRDTEFEKTTSRKIKRHLVK